jgi:SAM-dependent methyltransferase
MGDSRLILSCPACGVPTGQRYLYSKEACDILQCEECGLGRAETTGFDPFSYYSKEYFSGGQPDGYADYLGAEPVLRSEFARVLAFLRLYCSRGRLLEIGCAYGFFLREARRHFDVSGIELAEDAAAYCRRLGLNVLQGGVDEDKFRRLGMLDVIVLLDVIEHLPNPRETIDLCSRYLSPGGVLLLTTGDFGSIVARVSGAKWRLMTPPQHLWFFTRQSLRRFAEGACLEFVSYDHPWKLVPLSLITFQLARILGMRPTRRPQASGFGIPVNLFDAMRVVLRKPSCEDIADEDGPLPLELL